MLRCVSIERIYRCTYFCFYTALIFTHFLLLLCTINAINFPAHSNTRVGIRFLVCGYFIVIGVFFDHDAQALTHLMCSMALFLPHSSIFTVFNAVAFLGCWFDLNTTILWLSCQNLHFMCEPFEMNWNQRWINRRFFVAFVLPSNVSPNEQHRKSKNKNSRFKVKGSFLCRLHCKENNFYWHLFPAIQSSAIQNDWV